MLDFYDALHTLMQTHAINLPSQYMTIEQCRNRILAKDLFVKISAPLFDNSAMDGYAICDTQALQWQNIATITAGECANHIHLESGQCTRIFTGAPIPAGCDAVIAQEDVISNKTGLISTDHLIKKNQHIRKQAEELQEGQLLLSKGIRLGPIQIALLSSQGYTQVPCFTEASVVVFSSGDELIEPGQNLSAGKIFDANRHFLLPALKSLPLQVTDGGILPDSAIQIRDAIFTAASHYDVIICSGGASVGDKDYLKDALEELGQLQNWKVSMKPGKPFAWGKCLNSHVFLLPGNPVASIVTYQLLAKPALELLIGQNPALSAPKRIEVKLKSDVENQGGRRHFVRAKLILENGQILADIHDFQGSHMLSACADAQLLLDIPAHTHYHANQVITAFHLD